MSLHNGANTHQLESDIHRDRSEIAQTLDAIEQRFSPGEIMDQALSYAKNHGGDFTSNFVDTVCKNPVATIMAGVGVAMLAVNQTRSADHAHTYDTGSNSHALKNKAKGYNEKAQHGMAKAKAQAIETWDDSRNSARNLTTQGRARAADAAHEASNFYRQNPLVVGAAAITIGALTGSLFHTTSKEQSLYGEPSKRAVDNVKSKASQLKAEGKKMSDNVMHNEPTSKPKPPEQNLDAEVPEPDRSQFEKQYIV